MDIPFKGVVYPARHVIRTTPQKNMRIALKRVSEDV